MKSVFRFFVVFVALAVALAAMLAPLSAWAQSNAMLYGTATDCKQNAESEDIFQYPSEVETAIS